MDEVVFGKPAAETVAELARRQQAERVFLMVSGTLNRETDEIERLRRPLGSRCAGTFDRMPAHTPRTAVIAAAEQARAAEADLIVTLGGGSITDGAKAVQICLANDIRTAEALDRVRAPAPVKSSRVRQISVPTTLSAGEFSPISGVTDERTKVKELFRHPDIVPRAVVLDPMVTRHTPSWLFLSTGIRAVDHCVEGICSNESTPYGDASALHGLALLARGLPKVKADPDDMEARLDCQIGAWLSMTPLVSGVPMGRAMESAMCWARCSTYRTGILPASCFPPSCAGTSRPTLASRRSWPPPWAIPVKMPVTCLTISSERSTCHGVSVK
jgi:alcohol dehydrogenase class IV